MPSNLRGATAFPAANVAQSRIQHPTNPLCYRHEDFSVTTLSDALAAYRIFAQAEGKSHDPQN